MLHTSGQFTLWEDEVAIWFATGSGALLLKNVNMTDDPPRFITIPPHWRGLVNVWVQPRGIPYDDDACYKIIKSLTGLIVDGFTDRCVVLDENNTVIDVHKRDPAISPLRHSERGVRLMLHRYAIVGDTLNVES